MARQRSMDRIVAIKVLPRSLAKEHEFKQRFFQEARAAGRLNHPNIVTAIDAQEAAGYCFIVMEYVEGKTASAMISQMGALPEAKALNIVIQIARGLAHAWDAHIVHRDVKPENFLCTKDGVAKLCDLGIAKAPTDAGLTQQGIAIGTPRYISPEQARGLPNVDFRADIYSLGASFFHMLAGVPPFEGPTAPAIMLKHINDPLPSLKKLAPDTGANTVRVIEKMMAKEPKDRYQNADDLLKDLQALVDGQRPPTAGGPKRPSGRRPATRRPLPAGTRTPSRPKRKPDNTPIIIAAVAAVAAILAFIAWPRPKTENTADSHANQKPQPDNKTTRESRARLALQSAKEQQQAGELTTAIALLDNLIKNWPDTESSAQARPLRKQLRAKLKEKQRIKTAMKDLAELLDRKKNESADKRLAALREFAANTNHTGPPAEKARDEIARIKAERRRDNTPESPSKKPEQLEQVRRYLKSGNLSHIEHALSIIIKHGRPFAELAQQVKTLAGAGNKSRIRILALSVLAKIAPLEARNAAILQLRDRNENVRLNAISHLQSQGITIALPHLQRMVTYGPGYDPSPKVIRAATNAIKSIKSGKYKDGARK